MTLSVEQSSLPGKIDAVIRFFLYVLIFWLPYSPAVVESCVVVSLVLWIFKRGFIVSRQPSKPALRQKVLKYFEGFKPAHSFINTPIVIFLSACLLSVLGSLFFRQSLHNFFTKTLEWFIIYFLVIEVFKEKKHIYTAVGVLIFTSFSTAIDSFIQFYFTHKDIFLGNVIEVGDRATAAFKTPNGLGGYLTLVIPVSLGLVFFKGKGFRYRIFTLLLFLSLMWSLALTFSRGAWMGTSLGVIFLFLVLLFCLPSQKTTAKTIGVLAIIAVCFCGYFISAKASYFDFPLLVRQHTIQWRLSIWQDSLVMIRERPFFGHGINTYMQMLQEYRVGAKHGPTYAHNCYIQLAAETGIVGLISFLGVIFCLFSRSLKRIGVFLEKDKDCAILSLALLSGVFAFLIHSFFDTNFYSLQLSAHLWLMIGMLMALNNVKERVRLNVNAH